MRAQGVRGIRQFGFTAGMPAPDVLSAMPAVFRNRRSNYGIVCKQTGPGFIASRTQTSRLVQTRRVV
ncbi:MAG: hypothetical protein AMJ66_07695 [Betaproteobacteria bacterium SG8_40]|nr:MAG: hypothetical protein AMJ66_07695 [Betaproteobacteria bacterium SG8_40]